MSAAGAFAHLDIAMNKRRLLTLMTIGVLALLACAALLFLLPKPIDVTEASCGRIQPGMTRTEVEAILGGPPGDYETGKRGIVLDRYGNGVLMEEGRMEEWGGDEGFLQIGFDENDSVLWTRFVSAGRRRTFIERWLRRSLW